MEKKTEWRCPYCDALNDWQDEVCQICGDGKRDETVETTKAKIVKETYVSERQSVQKPDTVQEHRPIEEQKASGKQKTVEETVPIKETPYTAPKSSDATPTAETKAEPIKKAFTFPTQCILSVICLICMFYTYRIGMVQDDKDSITLWFGIMAVMCVANAGTIWLKWMIFYIIKFFTDGMGVGVTIVALVQCFPDWRSKINSVDDIGIVAFVVIIWGISALNLWLTSDSRKKK